MLEQQELLWEKQSKSHNKHCQRFLSFPAELFEHVFHDLPQLQARWHQRQNDLFRSQSNTHSILKTFGLRMGQH